MKKKMICLLPAFIFPFHFLLLAQNVGIGLLSPTAKLHIKGSADTSQLIIDANSIQSLTHPLIRLRSSAGADLMWIHSNDPSNNFVGVNAGRVMDASAGYNTLMGKDAGYSNTTGSYNTGIGHSVLFNTTTGTNNTANGYRALYYNTTGDYNTSAGAYALDQNTTGTFNTGIGVAALSSNVAGSNATAIGFRAMGHANNSATPFNNYNVAVGYEALRGSTFSDDNTGNYNTALGYQTIWSDSTGSNNMAVGYRVLYNNLSGNYNSASGNYALYQNTNGNYNTASGVSSLQSNKPGNFNCAFGLNALYSNEAGSNATAIGAGAMLYAIDISTPFTNNNVALGFEALRGSVTPGNNTGLWNTALGYQTLWNNTTGHDNTATGFNALIGNTIGTYNTADGANALSIITSGNSNTACGQNALVSLTVSDRNTAIGRSSGDTYNHGNYNTFVGAFTDANAAAYTNSSALGDGALFLGINYIRIGDGGVSTIGGAVAWSNLSDGRFKTNIKEEVIGLDFILGLRPITYHMDVDGYNRHIFGEGYEQSDMKKKYDDMKRMGLMENEVTTFSGFIAQEVEQTAKATGYNFSGVVPPKNEKDVYSLRYAEFVVPLVKAVQELNNEVVNLRAENEELRQRLDKIEAMLNK